MSSIICIVGGYYFLKLIWISQKLETTHLCWMTSHASNKHLLYWILEITIFRIILAKVIFNFLLLTMTSNPNFEIKPFKIHYIHFIITLSFFHLCQKWNSSERTSLFNRVPTWISSYNFLVRSIYHLDFSPVALPIFFTFVPNLDRLCLNWWNEMFYNEK